MKNFKWDDIQGSDQLNEMNQEEQDDVSGGGRGFDLKWRKTKPKDVVICTF